MSADRDRHQPNRLIHSTSPYLQQHAHNPVDWYPWGEEALELARRDDRPIFLSIGYSSCHWCHVMERESFENPAIARLMNEHFVNIKVDREERPDIDSIYMLAVRLITGQSGWPMSVFLTPDLRPFWGGTYIPPERRFGKEGFTDVLVSLAGVFRSSREEIEEVATEFADLLVLSEYIGGDELLGVEALAAAARDAARRFDVIHGGFGPAPKFPRSIEVSMLLRAFAWSGDTRTLDMCELTLEAMAHGGIYDQFGGGFHRYSTDSRWLVPHFEKMLYDNALLVRAYLESFQLRQRELDARVAAEVLDYVLRDMTGPEGGFYSATDADSEGEEGVFFVWTPAEVEAVVGADDARLVCERFGITANGNFEGGKSIPHVARPIVDVARVLEMAPETVRTRLAIARTALRNARESRPKPFRDEKILTSWNGLMISAFARGAQVFDDPRYESAARAAAELILASMQDADGRLLRVRKDGVSHVLGFLDDYAYFIEGLLDLWETTFEPRWLAEARRLSELVIAGFRDAERGGFFLTSEAHQRVLTRRKDPLDNATPSPAGVFALDLLRLERLTGDTRYRELAEHALRSVGTVVDRVPLGYGSTLIAVDRLVREPLEIVIVGDPRAASTRALLRAVHRGFLPARTLVAGAVPVSAELAELCPLLADKPASGGVSTAYVCSGFACREPVTTPEELAAQLPFVDSRKG